MVDGHVRHLAFDRETDTTLLGVGLELLESVGEQRSDARELGRAGLARLDEREQAHVVEEILQLSQRAVEELEVAELLRVLVALVAFAQEACTERSGVQR